MSLGDWCDSDGREVGEERVTEFHLTTVHQGSAGREVGGERVTEFHLTTVHQGSAGREVGGERVKVWHLMMYVCVCVRKRER